MWYDSRMTLDTLIMLVGAFIAALPLGGLPRDWQDTFVFLAGVVVIALGIVVRRRTGREMAAGNDARKLPSEAHYEDSR